MVCIWVCVKYDCVFPQHMVVDHSSHTGSEPLTTGWIVSLVYTTYGRTFLENFSRPCQCVPACVYMSICVCVCVLTPDSFFSQGRQKLARFNAREFATLIIDILSDAKRRQQGKGLSSPTGETLEGRERRNRTEDWRQLYSKEHNLDKKIWIHAAQLIDFLPIPLYNNNVVF